MLGLRRVALAPLLCVVVAWLPAQSPAPPTAQADAERCEQKLARIQEHGLAPRVPNQPPERTIVSEAELNAYLQLILQAQLPAGVIEPSAALMGQGRFDVRTVLDLEVVRGQGKRGLTDPLRYLGGRVPLEMTCVLRTQGGQGTLELVSATLSGLPVPRFVADELVAYATRTPDNPQGFQFARPFNLPAAVQEIQVGKGEVLIVQ